MLLPVKLIFPIERHGTLFCEIPMGKIQNAFHGFRRSFLVLNETAGGSEEQGRHYKEEPYSRQERFHIQVRPSQTKEVTEQVPCSSIELRPRFPKRLPQPQVLFLPLIRSFFPVLSRFGVVISRHFSPVLHEMLLGLVHEGPEGGFP